MLEVKEREKSWVTKDVSCISCLVMVVPLIADRSKSSWEIILGLFGACWVKRPGFKVKEVLDVPIEDTSVI